MLRRTYRTKLGESWCGDARDFMRSEYVEPRSVDLVYASPPFPTVDWCGAKGEYVRWLSSLLPAVRRVMSPRGSLVLDLGGTHLPGRRRRSTHAWEAAVEVGRHLELCQEFYWYNPVKMPSPSEWDDARRFQAKDSVSLILWFAYDADRTLADASRVSRRLKAAGESLIQVGHQFRTPETVPDCVDNLLGFAHYRDEVEAYTGRPWGHLDGEAFGRLYPNLVTDLDLDQGWYEERCRALGMEPHPARAPTGNAAFFVEFLTEPGGLVLNPFAGSNVSGYVCERLGRRWLACEREAEHAMFSALRFEAGELLPCGV